MDGSLHQFCKLLPKIELHAHLNGSIRESTLVELARERSVSLPVKLLKHEAEHHDPDKEALFFNTKPRSLEECFEIFGYIPSCVNDVAALKRITQEVLLDFAHDNVVYLELRTGPKVLLLDHNSPEFGFCSKRQYVTTILEIMISFEKQEQARYDAEISSSNEVQQIRLPLMPRLIISVDRSGTVEQAEENINLALEMNKLYPEYIVGVELGGNPTRNDFRLFEHVFKKARDNGLNVSIHCGEVPTAQDASNSSALKKAYDEALAVVNFRPDRLGHALLLPDALMNILMQHPIPIECCPTSNVMTLELAMHHGGNLMDGLKSHPQLEKWIDMRYPFSINTDDSGIFCTNLTKEYLLVAKVFGLSNEELSNIVIRTIDHIFDTAKNRESLRALVLQRVEMLKRHW
jgi:adenosine deaminase